MSESDEASKRIKDLPKSRIRKSWRSYLFWVIPLAAACMAAYYIYTETIQKGPTIMIIFPDAASLQAGKSQVKYRGLEVGVVKSIDLTKDESHVQVTVSLHSAGANMAKEGSQFWIVQPHVGLYQIKGLGTVVSGDYIAVEPGGGKDRSSFIGLTDEALPPSEAKGLRIMLVLERLAAVQKHSPVIYRGIQVGEVWDAKLGPQSQVVYIYADIKKNFAPLVRTNSKFWNAGGVNFQLGLSGLKATAESVQTLITGGIEFATPDPPGRQAIQDTAFTLYEKPDQSWLSWAPRIDLPEYESAFPPKKPKP